tara:strand:+ start:1030858 stop:1031166 length:309 start_codon:yes stop_codon:yes gene_type:complete
MSQDPKRSELSISSDSPPAAVPTFPCIVYVTNLSTGGVHARVANLAGIDAEAENEREALGKIVPEFKRQVGQLVANGDPVPWIDPPAKPGPDEQKRFVPVHL